MRAHRKVYRNTKEKYTLSARFARLSSADDDDETFSSIFPIDVLVVSYYTFESSHFFFFPHINSMGLVFFATEP